MSKQENNPVVEKIYDNVSKYFALIIFLVVVVVLVLFYLFLINPKLKDSVSKVQNDINFQQNIWNIERQKLTQMQESLDYFRKIDSDDVEFLESVIPHPYPKEKLFGEIEDIILLNGYTLTSLSIDEVEPLITNEGTQTEENKFENLQVINISLDILGLDYSAMKRFLPVLENQLPLMDIVNLEFSPSDETLSLNIYTYYFKP